MMLLSGLAPPLLSAFPLAAEGGTETIMLAIVGVITLGVGAQWLAWRFRLPSILLLLAFGFVAGPITGVFGGDALQGDWVFAFVSLSIGVILFEGGLSLRMSELREVGQSVLRLITIGVAVTWALAAVAAHYLLGFDLQLALLLGALLTVTGPTVIVPLLRHVRPTGRVGTIAKWEGITIDPVGAILAVLVLEAILLLNGSGASGAESAFLHAGEGLLTVIVVGVGVSVVGAVLLVTLLRQGLVPDYLQNAASLMIVVLAFALSNVLQEESGLLTTTLMGIIIANQPYVSVRRLAEFKEDLQVLLISSLFIVLSARLQPEAIEYIGMEALLFLALLILVVRPLAVYLSSLGTPLDWNEWAFISWLAPRGIVAAAVSALFAFRLEGVFPAEQVGMFVPIVFLVIVGTVAIYGLTISPLARWLGLAQPNPQGVLFVGAHEWSRKMARALHDLGFNTLLIDSNARNIQYARQEGLLAERANALSEHVIDDLDLSGIGRLLALTPNEEVNSLAALHFAEVFESIDIYQIPTRPVELRDRSGDLPRHLRGRPLFGPQVTYSALAQRFGKDHEVRAFELEEGASYEDLKERYEEGILPLFLVRGDQLSIFSEEGALVPQEGDTLVALVPPVDDAAAAYRPKGERASSTSEEEKTFREVVERAPVLDLHEASSFEKVVRQAAGELAERTGLDAEDLIGRYIESTRHRELMITRGAAIPHFRDLSVENPELVLVRCTSGLCIEFDESEKMAFEPADPHPAGRAEKKGGQAEWGGEGAAEAAEAAAHTPSEAETTPVSDPVYAFFFLLSPEAKPSKHLQLLAQIARHLDSDTFLDEWRAARDEEQVRQVLLQAV